MRKREVTSNREDRLRWAMAIVTPWCLLVICFFTVRLPLPSSIAIEPPALELDYVVLEQPKKLEEPKPEPKPVVAEPKPVPIAEPKPEVAAIEESPISDVTPDIAIGEPADDTTFIAPVPNNEPTPAVISSAEVLDNTSFAPVFNPKPNYPVVARRNRISGYVDLDLTISKDGRVKEYEIVRSYGHPMFGIETGKVIGRWRFPPPRINGERMLVIYRYRVKFELN